MAIQTKRVTVDTTAGGTLLVAANARRSSLVIAVPTTGAQIFVGPSGVTSGGTAATDGLPVPAGQGLAFAKSTGDQTVVEAFYAITAAGSTAVHVLEGVSG